MSSNTYHKYSTFIPTIQIDLLKAFGADLQTEIKEPVFLVGEDGRALLYPVGSHLALRDIEAEEDFRKTDIMFIYNDSDAIKVTAINSNKDHSHLLVCDQREHTAVISVYALGKISFRQVTIFKTKRKVISNQYKKFIYASFNQECNKIAAIGIKNNQTDEVKKNYALLFDIEIFQTYSNDNYQPISSIEVPSSADKITIDRNLVCVSGGDFLAIYHIYVDTFKDFKIGKIGVGKNIVIDHCWCNTVLPNCAVLLSNGDVLIYEAYNELNQKVMMNITEDTTCNELDPSYRAEKFVLKEHIQDIFKVKELDDSSADDSGNCPTCIKEFNGGMVVGNKKGELKFIEQLINNKEYYFEPVGYAKQTLPYQNGVKCVSFNSGDKVMAICFETNDIGFISMKNIFENVGSKGFELHAKIVCDGFHSGAITAMDIALQRPVIVTCSNEDKTIRVWNYLTGHCEYCGVILTKKELNQDKDLTILALAVHPNGYYIAISDKEMIRFLDLCYKELRYHNSDETITEKHKANCTVLKFSYGGQILAASTGRTLYLIHTYTREVLKEFAPTMHTGIIKKIVFSMDDHYLYTVGTEGFVIEYNLFLMKDTKIWSNGCNFFGLSVNTLKDKNICVSGVCSLNSTTHYLTEVVCVESLSPLCNEMKRDYFSFKYPVQTKLTSLETISMKSGNSNLIQIYAAGGEDGYMNLFKQLSEFNPENETYFKPIANIKSHKGAITAIAYSFEMHLLFSAGDDGNVFVYCIQETKDGENVPIDGNASNFSQISSVLDEGLGEYVLYPIKSIYNQAETNRRLRANLEEYQQEEIKAREDQKKEILSRNQVLKEEMNRQTKELQDKIRKVKEQKTEVIEHYTGETKELDVNQRKKLIEEEKENTATIDELSNQIQKINNDIEEIKLKHLNTLKEKDIEYEHKFKVFGEELGKNFEDIKRENDRLRQELQLQQKLEEYKFINQDQEHEQEVKTKTNKFQSIINKLNNESVVHQGVISTLNDEIKKLKETLEQKTAENKNKEEEKERLTKLYKRNNEIALQKETLKEQLNVQLKETEGNLQEKTKVANFYSKLKNELYLKNNEVLAKFNSQQIANSELKETTHFIERNLDENIKLIQCRQNDKIRNLKEKDDYKALYEQENHKLKLLEKDFDDLLQKIYDTFQSNDKVKIVEGIKSIYAIYLTPDKVKRIDDARLNVNIKDELVKQIDFLEQGISAITDTQSHREKYQKREIRDKTKVNSDLINELRKLKKWINIRGKRLSQVQSALSALKQRHLQYMRMKNMKKGQKMSKTSYGESFLPKVSMKYGNEFENSSLTVSNFFKAPRGPQGLTGNAIYVIKHNNILQTQKKSWKTGKLYNGQSLSSVKDSKIESVRIAEIRAIMEEKEEIIRRQNIEIHMLEHQLENIKIEGGKGYTTYANGFRKTSDFD